MAGNTGTHSTIEAQSGLNKTSTSISTHILIMVNNTPVGAIQRLSVDETRNIKMIDEVGTDGHIDSVPTSSTNIGGSCDRIRFDRLRIAEAFSRGFTHVSSQQYPFDIVLLDRQKNSSATHIHTVIKNVWIKSIGYEYSADNWLITDRMQWEAEAIYSRLGTSNNPVATGGELGIKFANIGVERETDTGLNGRRGSLDAQGLIDLAVGQTPATLF